MTAPIGRLTEAYEEPIYSIFRVLVGFLLMQHGVQKLFGLFGGIDGTGSTASLVSMYGIAGIIKLLGGFLIAVGMLTRLIVFVTIGEMVAAQFIAHLLEGIIPIQNGGELGLLYIAAFLILLVYGSGRYSFEHMFSTENSSSQSTVSD